MMRTLTMVILLFSFAAPRTTHAVSFSPVPGENEEKADKGIRTKGEKVCLFQSGTVDVRRAIGAGDVLVVYRPGKDDSLQEVGRIKVLSYVGADYLKAEVVEGELRAGDVARKGGIASLVISSEDRCSGRSGP